MSDIARQTIPVPLTLGELRGLSSAAKIQKQFTLTDDAARAWQDIAVKLERYSEALLRNINEERKPE